MSKERIPRKRKKLINKLAKETAEGAKKAVDLLIKSRYETSVIPFIAEKEYLQEKNIRIKELEE